MLAEKLHRSAILPKRLEPDWKGNNKNCNWKSLWKKVSIMLHRTQEDNFIASFHDAGQRDAFGLSVWISLVVLLE